MGEGPPVVPGPLRVGVPALRLELRSVFHLAFYVRFTPESGHFHP